MSAFHLIFFGGLETKQRTAAMISATLRRKTSLNAPDEKRRIPLVCVRSSTSPLAATPASSVSSKRRKKLGKLRRRARPGQTDCLRNRKQKKRVKRPQRRLRGRKRKIRYVADVTDRVHHQIFILPPKGRKS